LRWRITALFVGIFAGSLVVFSALLYQSIVAAHETEFDAALYNYAIDVGRSIEVGMFGQVEVSDQVLQDSEKVFPFALGETFIQIRTPEGRTIARSKSLERHNIELDPEMLAMLEEETVVFHDIQSEALPGVRGRYRVAHYMIRERGPVPMLLQVAVPMRLLQKERQNLLRFFLISIPFILLIATVGGYFLSASAMNPVKQIIKKSRLITARALSTRLEVPEIQDEIRELVETLNDLLERLEASFKSQESFISDASHQLKTPLAILQGELDLMLSKDRSMDEVREFFKSAQEEVLYLSRMVEHLLLLARVSGESSVSTNSPIQLEELLVDVTGRLGILAQRKNQRLVLEVPDSSLDSRIEPVIQGDADLLRSMLESLIENAIKYSANESRIQVTLELLEDFESQQVYRISIVDQGIGMTEEQQKRIFERFYRVDSNKDRITGSGLGLPIAQKIANLHQTEIQVESAPGEGSRFWIDFSRKK
jgi:signal transduction histidine kinase